MNSVFKKYGDYYNLLYQDKDYEGEVNYIDKLITNFGQKKNELLEFGSGTGDHASFLTKHGYVVHGIERSLEMVALSKKSKGFTCEHGDITKINLGRSYDCVLSLFHVVNYQITNQQINSVFANAASHLNKGGLFIFDFWYSPAVYAQKPILRLKRVSNKIVKVTRIAEPIIYSNDNRVDIIYTFFLEDLITGSIHTFEEIHPLRHFNLLELDKCGANNNFELINSEEFMTSAKLSEQTWSACAVFRKI